MQNSLRTSEWILVGSLLLVMASLLLIAKINASLSSAPLALQSLPAHALYPVTIAGAVAKPGTYEALPGTPLKKVLLKCRPSRFADLKKIDLEQRVEGPMSLHLEELSEIAIQVVGVSPEPLELILPAGTRVCDLKSKIQLRGGEAKSYFKSRRLLKDGEILIVPKK